MNDNAAQTVLEEVLRLALEEALVLNGKKILSEEDSGALVAYFNLLEFAKEQAAIKQLRFNDQELAEFNPYSLIEHRTA